MKKIGWATLTMLFALMALAERSSADLFKGDPPQIEIQRRQAEIQKCTKRGGTYKKVGIAQSWSCVIPYPDGGRICSDASECRGGCSFRFGSIKPRPKVGDHVKGACWRDNAQFGCAGQVKHGRLQNDICID